MAKKVITNVVYTLDEDEVRRMLSTVMDAKDIPEYISSVELYEDGGEWIGPGDVDDADEEQQEDQENWKNTYSISVG